MLEQRIREDFQQMKKEFKNLWKRTWKNVKRNATAVVLIFGISFISTFQQMINGVAMGASMAEGIKFLFLNIISTWGIYLVFILIVMLIVYTILAWKRSKGHKNENK